MTDKEAKYLFKNGHSVTELIKLFNDRQEQKDLYVNTALVYKDFETIVTALSLLKHCEEQFRSSPETLSYAEKLLAQKPKESLPGTRIRPFNIIEVSNDIMTYHVLYRYGTSSESKLGRDYFLRWNIDCIHNHTNDSILLFTDEKLAEFEPNDRAQIHSLCELKQITENKMAELSSTPYSHISTEHWIFIILKEQCNEEVMEAIEHLAVLGRRHKMHAFIMAQEDTVLPVEIIENCRLLY